VDVQRISHSGTVDRKRTLAGPVVRLTSLFLVGMPWTLHCVTLTMHFLVYDLREAWRRIRKYRMMSLAIVLTLGVGIGGASFMFSALNNTYFAPMPFAEGDRLVRVRDYAIGEGGTRRMVSVMDFEFQSIRREVKAFSGVVAQQTAVFTMTSGDHVERVSAVAVSEGWAQVLGIRAILGRTFTTEEERQGRDSHAVLISHQLWQNRFGGSANVLQEGIQLNGLRHSIVGVLPAGFHFPYDSNLWIPGKFERTESSRVLAVVGRLQDGSTIDQARAELGSLALRLESAHPETNKGWGLYPLFLREELIENQDTIALLVFGTVCFLLLIACANVANVQLARTIDRRRDIAIRLALGASSWWIGRQILVESIMLSVFGGTLGMVLVLWSGQFVSFFVPDNFAGELNLGSAVADYRLLLFAVGVTVLSGFLFGIIPSLNSGLDNVLEWMKPGGGTFSAAGLGRRILRGITIAEIAVTLALLMGAVLMQKNLSRLAHADLGFPREDLLTMRLGLGEGYAQQQRRVNLVHDITNEIRQQPGVASVGVSTANPICCGHASAAVVPEGTDRGPSDPPQLVNHRYVTPGFFQALGVPLIRGRVFTERDTVESEPVVVVDQRLAKHFWPDQDAIGKRIRLDRFPDSWRTIVGVVGAVDDSSDANFPAQTWYLPYDQEHYDATPLNLHIMVRTESKPEGLARSIQAAIGRVAPNSGVYEIRTMSEIVDQNIAPERLGAIVSSVIAGFGLVLAALGIYSLVAFQMSRRLREIAVRRALGARHSQILSIILSEASQLSLGGGLIGLLGAWGVHRIFQSVSPGAAPADFSLYAWVTGITIGVTFAASLVPAWSTLRMDPVLALREE
jgi:putative ABC transport system permease protein